MGLFDKLRENREAKKELEAFKSLAGVKDEVNLNTKKGIAQDQKAAARRTALIDRLKDTKRRLLKENYASEEHIERLEDIISRLANQGAEDNRRAAAIVDVSIERTLRFIEKNSDRFGSSSLDLYLDRLEDLVAEREDPSPKYADRKYMEMEHNLFLVYAALDATRNSLDRTKTTGAKYKREALEAKEAGNKVLYDRKVADLQRIAGDLEARQGELDALLKKEKLAQEIRSIYAVAANNKINFSFTEEDYDELNDICSENCLDDKRINQGFGIVNKYKTRLKEGNFQSAGVGDNDFESSTTKASISDAAADELFSKF